MTDRAAWSRAQVRALMRAGVSILDATASVRWVLAHVPEDADLETYIIPDEVWDAEAQITPADMADSRADWYFRNPNKWAMTLDAIEQEDNL